MFLGLFFNIYDLFNIYFLIMTGYSFFSFFYLSPPFLITNLFPQCFFFSTSVSKLMTTLLNVWFFSVHVWSISIFGECPNSRTIDKEKVWDSTTSQGNESH